MDRRNFLKTTLAAGSALALQSCLKPNWKPGSSATRPNIVLIMADDLGSETIGCYGGQDYETPNIDALAATGIRFDQCYSQPLCTPSRVQIMTGRYNHRNYEGFGYLNPREITFANILKNAGYRTCIAGKWQLCGDADTVRNFGFDQHCLWNMHTNRADTPNAQPPKSGAQRYTAPTLYENGQWTEYGADAYGPDVCSDFICSFIEENKHEPFLVYYPMILPHDPLVPTPDSVDKTQREPKPNFIDMVQYTDKMVGKIVSQLEEQGVRDNTLILFTGDNGTLWRITSSTTSGDVKGGKAQMTNAGTHVPLIANWPGITPPGRVVDDLVDFSDFLPTLCDAALAPQPFLFRPILPQ